MFFQRQNEAISERTSQKTTTTKNGKREQQ